jgi:hypothetical protein
MMAKLCLKSAFGYLLGITGKQIQNSLGAFLHSVKAHGHSTLWNWLSLTRNV